MDEKLEGRGIKLRGHVRWSDLIYGTPSHYFAPGCKDWVLRT